jgi:hypothetical protein
MVEDEEFWKLLGTDARTPSIDWHWYKAWVKVSGGYCKLCRKELPTLDARKERCPERVKMDSRSLYRKVEQSPDHI